MTTKEQERKALAQIRKIVEGLGADSYIAAAFDGCFEIAEDNIENDFACSMKQRAESAEEKFRQVSERNIQLGYQFDDMKKKLASLEAARDSIAADLCKANEKALSPWLFKEIKAHYTESLDQDTKRMAGLADVMADYAETPQDIAFIHAFQNYRKCKERKELASTVLAALDLHDPEK